MAGKHRYRFLAALLRPWPARRKATLAQAGVAVAHRETEQARALAARLQEAQLGLQHYQRVVANTADMLALVDADLRYVVTNPAYAAFVDSTPQALQGRTMEEVLAGAPGGVYAKIRPLLAKALAGEPQHFDFDRTYPDGRRVALDVHYLPYLDDAGVVQGVVFTLRDVSDVRDSAAATRRSEERLRLALDASNDGLWDWDMHSGTVYRSPRYHDIVGHAAPADVNDFGFIQRITHPDDRARLVQAINDHRHGSSAAVDMEFRVITGAGDVRWMRVRGGVVARAPDGTPLRMLGTLSDITAAVASRDALRSQAAELAQRNAELERFNRAIVGREMDMLALKQQVNTLARELGRPAPHALAFLSGGEIPEPAVQV